MNHRLAVLAMVSFTACSSDSSPAWVPGDIDEKQSIDRLGAAGYTEVCSAFEDHVRDTYRSNALIRGLCTARALQSTDNAADCGAAIDPCVNSLPPDLESQLQLILAQADCNRIGVTQTGCSSPVSALTTCLDDLGAQLDTIELELTCAAFGSMVPVDWWEISLPSSCLALSSGC